MFILSLLGLAALFAYVTHDDNQHEGHGSGLIVAALVLIVSLYLLVAYLALSYALKR